MQRYRDTSGNSGVEAYATAPDAITVRFKSGAVYVYTHASAGRRTVDHMKRLAADGKGLATFISRHVHDRYEAKSP